MVDGYVRWSNWVVNRIASEDELEEVMQEMSQSRTDVLLTEKRLRGKIKSKKIKVRVYWTAYLSLHFPANGNS